MGILNKIALRKRERENRVVWRTQVLVSAFYSDSPDQHVDNIKSIVVNHGNANC